MTAAVIRPKLTARQRAILTAIRTQVAAKGYPPTVREIGIAVGLQSPGGVAYQLTNLQRLGYLHRDEGLPRAIALTEMAGVVL